MASRNHELENISAETKPRVPPRPHLFFSNEIRRRRRMYEPMKNSPVPRRAVNPWNNGTGATLDILETRPSRRRDLAGYIFPRDVGARVRVPYVCRVYGKRRSWMVGGDIRGEGWRGGGRPRHPYNEERGRGKKRRLICRPRTSPIRVLFVPPAIFLYPLLSGCTPELCVFPWVESEGMEVSWKKGAGIIV